MTSLNKKCDYCNQPKNRANFVNGKCHDCNKKLKAIIDKLDSKPEAKDRECPKCEEIKPIGSFSRNPKGFIYRNCDACRALPPKNAPYVYPDGFCAMTQHWLSRRWA